MRDCRGVGRGEGWGEGWVRAGVRLMVECWGAGWGYTVTSCGLVKKTPSATKTEPMMARFCGVPLALMNEKRPPP